MNGFLDRLLQNGADLLATAQGSAERWAEELRAEERRFIQMIVWVGITFLFGATALLLLSGLVLALVPAHWRIQGLGVLAALYLAAFIALALGLRRRLAQPARLPVTTPVVFLAQVLAALPRLVRHKSDPSS